MQGRDGEGGYSLDKKQGREGAGEEEDLNTLDRQSKEERIERQVGEGQVAEENNREFSRAPREQADNPEKGGREGKIDNTTSFGRDEGRRRGKDSSWTTTETGMLLRTWRKS